MKALPLLEDLAEALGGLSGRSVLVRVDFNVPLCGGEIADDLRIRAALPTLRWLQEQEAKVTAVTHLGRPRPADHGYGSRPGGSLPGSLLHNSSLHKAPGYEAPEYEAPGYDARFSVEPVRRRLAQLSPGVTLAENLRFHPGEVAGDIGFAAQLVRGYDAYVNDAFGASHRAHGSIVGPPRLLPSAAGRLLAREAEVLRGLRAAPRRPFIAVLGGSKVSDKLGVVEALLEIVDSLVIGGGMCFTFLKARGCSVGASLCEDDMVGQCRDFLDGPVEIHLPCDIVAVSPDGAPGDPSAGGEVRYMGQNLPEGWMGADIGPGSAAAFAKVIYEAGTVLWNGPMGVFEDSRFESGTRAVADSMRRASAFTVVGGGDSAAAVRQFGLADGIDHISTGGGAALELIEKGDLPGLAALRGAWNTVKATP